jgi:predicted RNase H-like HicB family nuclease
VNESRRIDPAPGAGWLEAGENTRQPPTIQESEQAWYRYSSGKAELGCAAGHAELDPKAGWSEEIGGQRMRRYMVVVEHGPSSWGAHVPDLPGCVAVGETRPEVLQLIREAIELHIAGLREEGLPVPEPSSEGEIVEVGAA